MNRKSANNQQGAQMAACCTDNLPHFGTNILQWTWHGLTFYRRKDPRGSGTLVGKTPVLPGFSKIERGGGSRGVPHWYCGLTSPGVRTTATEAPMQRYVIPILSFQVLTSFQTMWFKTDQKCLISGYPLLGGFTNYVEKGRRVSSPKMLNFLSMFINISSVVEF